MEAHHALGIRRLFFVLGFLAIGSGVHCKRTHHGTDGESGEYAVVRTKDGGETRVRLGAAPIPPEFPPTMQIYPGAEFTSTARTKKSVVVALSTTDSLEAVFAFYRKQPGYDELSDVEVDGMRVLHLKNPASGKDFQVVVKVEGRTTKVSLVAPLE